MKGEVAKVSSSSLILLVPGVRTFGATSVSEIRRTDSIKNGALIGLIIGAGVGIAGIAAMCADGPDCGPSLAFGAMTMGIGTAVGAGIDALVGIGGRVLYRSPQGTGRVRFSPFSGEDVKGLAVSVSF
jgi:hypothetical protein